MIKKPLPVILSSLLCLLIIGCGWQLRGTTMIPEGLESLHIAAPDNNPELARQLRQALKSAGITVPESADEAQYSLVILSAKPSRRTATVNPNARVSELELTEEVTFMIRDHAGQIAIPSSTVIAERVFEYDENNVVATQDEERLIRGEMRRDLVGQILNRLRQLRDTVDATAP
jgi:LPS-assembly lipoprotein